LYPTFITLCLFVVGLYAPLVDAASCRHPSVRREWRSMSKPEREDWIRAVNCLSHLPHDSALSPSVDPSISQIQPVNSSGSYYDDFVYMHMDLNTRIHFTGLFLPWHRWYVHVYETALKEKCAYTGSSPYWNWSRDSRDVYDSDLFKDPDPVSGLGGWGSSTQDFSVLDGGFRTLTLSYPSRHVLRRNFTLQPYLGQPPPFFTEPAKLANTSFTPAEVAKMVNGFEGDFKGFQKYFESFEGAHGSVHLVLGGDLAGQCPINAPKNCTPGPTWSANEPLFWMHHAMVDKVWSDWQNKHPANFWEYSGGSVQAITNVSSYEQYPNGGPPFLDFNTSMPADGMFPVAKIRDVMNTTGGLLCYVYE